jgi:hypothetical protein
VRKIFYTFAKKIMKREITTLLFAALLLCNVVYAQDKSKKPTQQPDSAAMMKAWQDYMTPGAMHKLMASWNGTWATDGKFWMDENAPATESKGSCVNSMTLNGLYQESMHKSTMMGMPFEGHGLLAFDNNRKVFISTWVDNMGSGVMILEGIYNSSAKTLTLTGSMDDPIKGKMKIRETLKIVDDNNQVMEMYAAPSNGKETKWMEIKFKKTS